MSDNEYATLSAVADALATAADEMEHHADNHPGLQAGTIGIAKAQQMRVDARWLRARAVHTRMLLLANR